MRGAGGWGPGAGWAVCALALISCGCGRYRDFTLPPVSGGDSNLTFQFEEQPTPVLTRGGEWDSRDVLNPSVTIRERGLAPPYVNLYSGFDGRTWRTGIAILSDGRNWDKRGWILQPDSSTWEGSYIAANGAALFVRDQLWYWYQAGPKGQPSIGVARCRDVDDCEKATSWRKEPKPVVDHGPYMSWDERAVADPYVIRIEPYFYMYYLGQDRAARQRLGLARSTDGVRWQKLRANPILELGGAGSFDENGLGEPAVWKSHGYYWMLYTGRDVNENRRLGLARSADGARWQKLPAVFRGTGAWDSKVICDPTVEVSGAGVVVWFGGGDVASPDENLNGQIGMGILRPVSAKEAH